MMIDKNHLNPVYKNLPAVIAMQKKQYKKKGNNLVS